MTRWKAIQEPNPDLFAYWLKVLNNDAVNARLFAQRMLMDTDSARSFLRPSLEQLHDPFTMHDMPEAAARVARAIELKERVLVYGDYDVDGTTSVAVMILFLRSCGLDPDFYIPNRYAEGYGISSQGVDFVLEQKYPLMIALDCGIRSVELSKKLKTAGVDLIICDHHNPGPVLPEALAVLDPKKPQCTYPYKELSGCGVGLKLIQAVCKQLNLPHTAWEPLLDLVAVSIACDIVPITGENRVLARSGLQRINEVLETKHGLNALLYQNPNELRDDVKAQKNKGTSKKEEDTKRKWTISDLVFIAGPRINAAGRIKDARAAVSLLLSDNPEDAHTFGLELNQYNAERRRLDELITAEALEQLPAQINKKSQIAYAPNWNKGVVGIVASRLIEQSYKPTIVLTEHEGLITGSARSVEGFDLYDALCECEHLLEKFGGHTHAAGLSLKPERLDAFVDAFEQAVAMRIKPEQTEAVLHYDMEIRLKQINGSMIKLMTDLAPFGPGNMQPVFMSRNVFDMGNSSVIGKDGLHLKLSVMEEGENTIYFGIGFKLAPKWADYVLSGKPFEMLYTLDVSYFNGSSKLQLTVKDIRKPE